MEPTISRRMLRTLEPYHGMIYFVPEARDAYEGLGLTGRRMGYFASRAAALGPVPPDVVIATFFNFHPALVRRSIPDAWARATPAAIIAARFSAADAALRRLLGPAVDGQEMEEAAALARDAAEGCYPEGRPLYAGHAALPWPDAPHMVLWHAQTLLREFRGDGHIAAMVTEGVTGPEALVIHAATGEIPKEALQQSRAWPDDEWATATERVRARGWLAIDGTLTPAGQKSRQWVEDRTDELMLACWERLGEDRCARLRQLVRPFSRAIAADAFDFGTNHWDD
jgi:hypothetical protein